MDALRAVAHVGVGRARRVVPLVVLARPRRARRAPSWMSAPAAASAAGGGAPLAVSNGSAGGPANGALISATERNTSGRTSAHQAATGEPKSCPTTAATRAVAERRHEPQRVAHQVEQAERAEVAVVVAVPAGGAPVAALVGRDHVDSRPRRAAASPSASCRRAPGSRAAAAGTAGRASRSRPPARACAGR